ALGNAPALLESGERALNPRDAVLQSVVIDPFVRSEIVVRMLAAVRQQETTAGGHAVTALGQSPAWLGARVAACECGKVHPARLDDFELLCFGEPGAVANQRAHAVKLHLQRAQKFDAARVLTIALRVKITEERHVPAINAWVAQGAQLRLVRAV